MRRRGNKRSQLGFTIVELSMAMLIIGILAGITIFSIGAWRTKLATSEVKSDLNAVKAAMESARNFANTYPGTLPAGFSESKNVDVTLDTSNGSAYCVNAVSKTVGSVQYFMDVDTGGKVREPMKGTCATGEVISGTIIAKWSDISVSTGTTCGVYDSRAFCRGTNTYGEVGDNSTALRALSTPVNTTSVLSGKAVTDISTGTDHSCALAEGAVYCWGRNDNGELGNGTFTDSLYPVPVTTSGVLAGKTITSLSVGSRHTCVLASAAIYCWGYNAYGQLGANGTTDSNVPIAVTTSGALLNKTETAVNAGQFHTCAIASGAAYCWGSNSNGQLGDNTNVQKIVPTAVNVAGVLAGKTIDSISAGGTHTCAMATGAAYCWGDNTRGQLGDNTVAEKLVPVAVYTAGVLSGKTVTKLDSGFSFTCAIATNAAYCWGFNLYGQLGDNTTVNKQVPVAVVATGVLSGKTPTTIKAGWYTACVLANSDNYCWGYGPYGQLGTASTTSTSVPVQATNP